MEKLNLRDGKVNLDLENGTTTIRTGSGETREIDWDEENCTVVQEGTGQVSELGIYCGDDREDL